MYTVAGYGFIEPMWLASSNDSIDDCTMDMVLQRWLSSNQFEISI
jgi:hypothetical protein